MDGYIGKSMITQSILSHIILAGLGKVMILYTLSRRIGKVTIMHTKSQKMISDGGLDNPHIIDPFN